MPKQLTAILLSLLYLLTLAGSAVNVHYCGGYIESVSFVSAAKSCCCSSDKAMACSQPDKEAAKKVSDKKGCCDDKTFVSDVEDTDRQTVSKTEWTPSHPAGLPHKTVFAFWQNSAVVNLLWLPVFIATESPPPDIPLWLRYCCLTLYA